jgi:hypothetical protein
VLKAIEQDEAHRKAQKQEKTKQSESTTKAVTLSQVEEPASSPEATPRKPKSGSLGNFF